ncbi:MAG: flagellin [Pseudomonadota bacterium]
MTSIFTNGSAMTALRQLRSAQTAADIVRSQISTGLKVQSAEDNPAFFLVSNTTRSDIAVLSGLKENLAVSTGAVKAAEAGLNQLNDLVLQLTDIIPVAQNGVAIEQLETAYDDILDQIRQTIEASSFQGTNLLTQSGATNSVIGLDRQGSSFNLQTQSLVGADFFRETFDGLVETGNQFVIDPAASAFAFGSALGSDTANTTDRLNEWEVVTNPADPLFGFVTWRQDSVGNDIYFSQADVDNFSPRMDIRVQVQNTGRYYINVRGFGTNGTSDSVHIGVDGVKITDNGGVNLPIYGGAIPPNIGWGTTSTFGGADVFVDILTPGIYTINIWGREDGVAIDRVEFTDDPSSPSATYDPAVTPIGGSDLPYFTNVVEGEARREAAGLMELLEAVNPRAMQLQPDQAMLVLDAARAKIARYQSQVGAYDKVFDRQTTYLNDLTAGLNEGVAALVEADLAEASSRLQAVQVAEQLAAQSLTNANQRTSLVLSLFQ